MTFQQPGFLLLLPLALIPLIISFFLSRTRVTLRFPSILLIKQAQEQESKGRKFLFRIRSWLRSAAAALLVFSYAGPMIMPSDGTAGNTLFIIDDTISMGVTVYKSALDNLRREIPGAVFLRSGRAWGEEKELYRVRGEAFTVLNAGRVTTFLRDNPRGRVIMVTDGQLSSIGSSIPMVYNDSRVSFLLCPRIPDLTNSYPVSVDFYPPALLAGVPLEIKVRIAGHDLPGVKVSVLVNGAVIHNGPAVETLDVRYLSPERSGGTGTARIEVRLTGDQFTNDNYAYFMLPVLDAFTYTGTDETGAIEKALLSIIPSARRAPGPGNTDLVFNTPAVPGKKNILRVLTADYPLETALEFRSSFGILPIWKKNRASGDSLSRFSILSSFRGVSLDVLYGWQGMEYDKNNVFSIGGIPAAWLLDNTLFIGFSLKDNLVFLENTPFLPYLLNEALLSRLKQEQTLTLDWNDVQNEIISEKGERVPRDSAVGYFRAESREGRRMLVAAELGDDMSGRTEDRDGYSRVLQERGVKAPNVATARMGGQGGILSYNGDFLRIILSILVLILILIT